MRKKQTSLRIVVLRRAPGAEPYEQSFLYEPTEPDETVADALTRLNEREELRDDPIRWEHSCLQRKCGACAMLMNGRPGLACGARLLDFGRTLRLEPLRKFPVAADLVADRTGMLDTLRALRVWLGAEADMTEGAAAAGYEASRCLQCGCCLEICPQFYPGGTFAGMAAAVPLSRLLAELPPDERAELADIYRARVYAGCGKSLACRSVCPAGIDIDELLARSNAAAVWKRLRR